MATYSEYLKLKKPYQADGHVLLLERKHACLFYKPGKGKTYPTIDALRDIDAAMQGNAKVLILSTANAVTKMWELEIEPQKILPKHTVIMSFTKAIQDNRKAELLKVKWDVIVVDECHHIKSHNSKISKLVYQLTKKSKYAFGLSGTPRGNSDVDIYCQFHNLNVSDWGSISYTNFVDICCEIDRKFFNGAMIKVPVGINDKYRAGFQRNVAMYSQRVDYDDEDKMPDLNIDLVYIPFTPTKQYLEAEQGVIRMSDYETTLTKLAVISKLHQLANGFCYITNENDERTTVQIQHNNKLDWIERNLTGEYTTIVYRHEEDFNQLMNILNKNGVTWTDDVVKFKEGKHNVLLLQCSQSESFNLQLCQRMIFYTMDYSFINFDQMLHRVYRTGQRQNVKITVLINDGSIDNKIWKIVHNKQTMSDLFYAIKGVV